jgi:hypothetical protein
LVDELLPDSFMKGAFRAFVDMLQEEGSDAPAALLAQVRELSVDCRETCKHPGHTVTDRVTDRVTDQLHVTTGCNPSMT